MGEINLPRSPKGVKKISAGARERRHLARLNLQHVHASNNPAGLSSQPRTPVLHRIPASVQQPAAVLYRNILTVVAARYSREGKSLTGGTFPLRSSECGASRISLLSWLLADAGSPDVAQRSQKSGEGVGE